MSLLLRLLGVGGDVSDSGTNTIVLPEGAGVEALADQGSESVVLVSTGSDALADAGAQPLVILTTGSDALADTTTNVVVLVASGTHTVEGVAQEPPPPPPPPTSPPEPQFPWSLAGSSDYAAQMRMEDQALVDRMEREGW